MVVLMDDPTEIVIGACPCNGCGNKPGPWHKETCPAYISEEDERIQNFTGIDRKENPELF